MLRPHLPVCPTDTRFSCRNETGRAFHVTVIKADVIHDVRTWWRISPPQFSVRMGISSSGLIDPRVAHLRCHPGLSDGLVLQRLGGASLVAWQRCRFLHSSPWP